MKYVGYNGKKIIKLWWNVLENWGKIGYGNNFGSSIEFLKYFLSTPSREHEVASVKERKYIFFKFEKYFLF